MVLGAKCAVLVLVAGCTVLSALGAPGAARTMHVAPRNAVRTQRAAPSTNSVLRSAGTYLATYEHDLTFLVADERYEQRVFDASGTPAGRREMTGDFFVTYVPERASWMSIHDVGAIDGLAVDDHQDLQRLLEGEPLAGLARRLI